MFRVGLLLKMSVETAGILTILRKKTRGTIKKCPLG